MTAVGKGCDSDGSELIINAQKKTTTVLCGFQFRLDATGSYDPDGDNLSYLWFCYPEAGTYGKNHDVEGAENIRHVNVHAPKVSAPCTIHYILKVTDKGTPRLTSYKRVVVTVVP